MTAISVRPDGNRPRVGVTLGEEASIGPEVMVTAISDALARDCDVLLCVGQGLVEWASAEVAKATTAQRRATIDVVQASGTMSAETVTPGRATAGGRRRAFEALQLLAEHGCLGHIDAMVTGPVTKGIFEELHPRPPGQTEYLAQRLGAERFAMMLAGPQLRVVPVTTHVPLGAVPKLLSTDAIVRCGQTAALDLQRFFDIDEPRIGVCGLNPHAGENGLLGDEEATVISPAVQELRALGVSAFGPLSADSAFCEALNGRWHAVLCMYHDQGLAPLKTVHGRNAINFTCGLPVPRIAPCHGTAFELAGQGIADCSSAKLAMQHAVTIARRATYPRLHRHHPTSAPHP